MTENRIYPAASIDAIQAQNSAIHAQSIRDNFVETARDHDIADAARARKSTLIEIADSDHTLNHRAGPAQHFRIHQNPEFTAREIFKGQQVMRTTRTPKENAALSRSKPLRPERRHRLQSDRLSSRGGGIR
tara:strand:- start:11670 stop:12062 length:393 start_codon:yes stop_codon:yes gene_type:complete